MGLINKLDAVGRKPVGLDGGLNLRADPIQLSPPQTTTADNVSYVTPGQVRQLPSPGASILPTFNNVYNVVNVNGVEPFGSGGVLAIQETITGPAITESAGVANGARTYPMLLRTRNLGTSFSANAGYSAQFATPAGLAADASYRPYVQTYFNPATAVLSYATGDLVTQSQTITGTIPASGGSGSNLFASTFVIGAFPGNTTQFFAVYYSGTNLTLGVFDYADATFVAYTLSSGAPVAWNTFKVGSNVYLTYIDSTTGLNLVQITATGLGSSLVLDSSAYAKGCVSVSGYACSPGAGAGLFAIWITNAGRVASASAQCYAQPVAAIGTLTNLSTGTYNFGSGSSTGATGIITCGVVPANPSFNHFITPNYLTTAYVSYPEQGTGDTAYGQPASTTTTHIIIRVIGLTVTAGAPTQALLANPTFRNASGANVLAGAVVLNGYDSNYAPYGPADADASILCPIVLGSSMATAAGAAQTPGLYALLDATGHIIGRWNDGLGAAAYSPPAYTTNIPFPQVPNLTPMLQPHNNALVDFVLPYLTPGNKLNEAAPLSPTVANTFAVNYVASGAFTYDRYQYSLATFSYQRQGATCPALTYGRSLIFGGTMTTLYDNSIAHEAGFHLAPRTITVGTCTGTVGTITASTYYSYGYLALYRWTDSQGLVHRSDVSPITQVVFGAALSGTFSINLSVTPPVQSYKYVNGSPLSVTLYRTLANGTQFYAVSTQQVTRDNSTRAPDGSYSDFFLTFQDSLPDAATPPNPSLNPIGASLSANSVNQNTATQLDILYVTADQSYPSQPPPPFIWQTTNAGRQFGLACVNGSYRVYFTQVWDEMHPGEYNQNVYVPLPPELGEVRSIQAMDDKVVVFGVRGLGYFNGSGPVRQIYSNVFLTSPQYAGFSFTTLPVPAGVVGTGSPVLCPTGIMYQDAEGFVMLDRSLNPTFVGYGDVLQGITGTSLAFGTIFGRGTLLPALQAIVWGSPTVEAVVWDYNQAKWSTWSALGNTIVFTQSQNKRVWAANQVYIGASMEGQNGALFPLNTFGTYGLGMEVETPWLQVLPSEGSTGPSGGNTGEGDILEMQVLGNWLSSHTLQIEQAVNYGPYKTNTAGPGWVTTFTVTANPAQGYQFKVTVPGTSRATAIRYRITLIPTAGNTGELARLSGIVLLSSSRSGLTRLGNTVSQ